jgi:hypothetical protein
MYVNKLFKMFCDFLHVFQMSFGGFNHFYSTVVFFLQWKNPYSQSIIRIHRKRLLPKSSYLDIASPLGQCIEERLDHQLTGAGARRQLCHTFGIQAPGVGTASRPLGGRAVGHAAARGRVVAEQLGAHAGVGEARPAALNTEWVA